MPSFAETLAKQAKKTDATLPYTLDVARLGSDKHPVLTLRYADDLPAFKSALLKHDRELRAHSSLGTESEEIKRARTRRMLSILARSGAVDSWEHVIEDGKPVTCDADAVEQLLLALYDSPDPIHQQAAMHVYVTCRNAMNFRASTDASDLGKG